MSCFLNEILIGRRVGGREPVLNVLLKAITYRETVGQGDEIRKMKTNVESCLYYIMFGEL